MSDINTQAFLEEAREHLGIEITITYKDEVLVKRSSATFESAEEDLGKLERSVEKLLLEKYGQ